MTTQRRISKKKKAVIEALTKSLGIISAACRATGITRRTYYNWLEADEAFRAEVEEVMELQKDFAESLMLKKMKEEDTTMLIFYAKTKMKDRGYAEGYEITGKGGKDLITQKSDEELDARIAELEKKLK